MLPSGTQWQGHVPELVSDVRHGRTIAKRSSSTKSATEEVTVICSILTCTQYLTKGHAWIMPEA